MVFLHKEKYFRFFANSWKQEENILRNYIEFISSIEKPIVYTYSGTNFDWNVLQSAIKRYNLSYKNNCVHEDLCPVIRKSFVVPNQTYKLKEIGSLLGYNFKHPHLDGLYVSSKYESCIDEKKKLPEEIFEYAEDDVRSLPFVIEKFAHIEVSNDNMRQIKNQLSTDRLIPLQQKIPVDEHLRIRTIQKQFSDDFLAKKNPSEVTNAYWIYATRQKGAYPDSNENSGKWLVFVHIHNVDSVWEKIKLATENGLLGDSSKVATAKPNPNAKNNNMKVICVYSYDYTDKDDVMRIREWLRKIGIENKIPYKSDNATRQGQYLVNGSTRISIYYE